MKYDDREHGEYNIMDTYIYFKTVRKISSDSTNKLQDCICNHPQFVKSTLTSDHISTKDKNREYFSSFKITD